MKMRLLYTALITSIILLSSCSKSKIESKIIGDWKMISVGHLPENSTTVWTFSADRNLYTQTIIDTTISIDTAQWSLDVKFGNKNQLTIQNLDPLLYDGIHLIHELDEYLSIQRIEKSNGHNDGAFRWTEFEKK